MEIINMMLCNDYINLNMKVMCDTVDQYETIPELQDAVHCSMERQYIVAHEDVIDIPKAEKCDTRVVVSGKRSFEAAKGYPGKKVAVLNFANNHTVGGSPFKAGAQEESLCRCSTLYPCLEAMKRKFYDKHIYQYTRHEINDMGNDDLIYTPDVVVFKTDERTDPVFPKMMDREDWYMVDVITCAAPQMSGRRAFPLDYESKIASRIKKIYDVAAKEHVDVLILGAWGCGAFGNSVDVVARQFKSQLRNYDFGIIEFALASRGDLSDNRFAQVLEKY